MSDYEADKMPPTATPTGSTTTRNARETLFIRDRVEAELLDEIAELKEINKYNLNAKEKAEAKLADLRSPYRIQDEEAESVRDWLQQELERKDTAEDSLQQTEEREQNEVTEKPISKTYYGHTNPKVGELQDLADVRNELERLWHQRENDHKNDKKLFEVMNRLLELEKSLISTLKRVLLEGKP